MNSWSGVVFQNGITVGLARYRKADLFYNIAPTQWGHGYATEALRRVLAFGFDTLQLHRIEAGAAVDNLASLRVMEKAGMIREGRHRKILPIPSGWSDNYSYAILENDPRP
ncbi:MAG: GNAT family protein [Bacteroidota bacterium]